jgi:ABC-type molybdate transport system ATPase subunit
VIAVFGQTGTGKTSFIKAVTGMDLEVGHNLASCKTYHLDLEHLNLETNQFVNRY